MSAKTKFTRWREERRLTRQLGMISRTVPGIGGPIGAVSPGGRIAFLRIPIGILLILGGVFSVLPGLGIWMLPLGLLLIAVDLPMMQRPVSAGTIRSRRWMQNRWRKNRWSSAP